MRDNIQMSHTRIPNNLWILWILMDTLPIRKGHKISPSYKYTMNSVFVAY